MGVVRLIWFLLPCCGGIELCRDAMTGNRKRHEIIADDGLSYKARTRNVSSLWLGRGISPRLYGVDEIVRTDFGA
jgi:hypothetical protein